MTYLEFRAQLIDFKVFSIGDAEKFFPGFDSRRLVEWQRKGHLQKLINKWYLFKEVAIDEMLLYRISNCLYRPSYISLQSALAYYHLLPEAVYTQTAVATRKTVRYNTPAGNFTYRSLKPTLYFGYQVLHKGKLPVIIAEPEKALLDFLYLTPGISRKEDIDALRLNVPELKKAVDLNKMAVYEKVFASATLSKKVKLLYQIF